jgi:hypothetical protein
MDRWIRAAVYQRAVSPVCFTSNRDLCECKGTCQGERCPKAIVLSCMFFSSVKKRNRRRLQMFQLRTEIDPAKGERLIPPAWVSGLEKSADAKLTIKNDFWFLNSRRSARLILLRIILSLPR